MVAEKLVHQEQQRALRAELRDRLERDVTSTGAEVKTLEKQLAKVCV